jgi:hypothetical protein
MGVLLGATLLLLVGCAAAAGPQWSEQDAIRVVQREFRTSISGCGEYSEYGLVARRECFLRDPVLAAIHRGLAQLPNRYVSTHIGMVARVVLADNIQWSAYFEGDQQRWRVEAAVPGAKSTPTLVFYAYEKTGLVEGVAQ